MQHQSVLTKEATLLSTLSDAVSAFAPQTARFPVAENLVTNTDRYVHSDLQLAFRARQESASIMVSIPELTQLENRGLWHKN